jgi:hypothetical protein
MPARKCALVSIPHTLVSQGAGSACREEIHIDEHIDHTFVSRGADDAYKKMRTDEQHTTHSRLRV